MIVALKRRLGWRRGIRRYRSLNSSYINSAPFFSTGYLSLHHVSHGEHLYFSFGLHLSSFSMMFEAFGFTQERTLHCRKSTQLPSEGLLWQYSSVFLILHAIVFFCGTRKLIRILQKCPLLLFWSAHGRCVRWVSVTCESYVCISYFKLSYFLFFTALYSMATVRKLWFAIYQS
jgi:hypothetical protein